MFKVPDSGFNAQLHIQSAAPL